MLFGENKIAQRPLSSYQFICLSVSKMIQLSVSIFINLSVSIQFIHICVNLSAVSIHLFVSIKFLSVFMCRSFYSCVYSIYICVYVCIHMSIKSTSVSVCVYSILSLYFCPFIGLYLNLSIDLLSTYPCFYLSNHLFIYGNIFNLIFYVYYRNYSALIAGLFLFKN